MIAHSTKELYKRHCPSSLTRYCWIGLRPLSKIPHCCPPHPSVGRDPESCLRFWRSFVYLRISPLHTKFHSPLSHSSELVSRAFRHFLATFTFNPIHRLRALYAQSFRRTLACLSYKSVVYKY
ncbi:hypothetical protein Hanom_Chr01g00050591 [Helianthus anomalus]